MRYARLAFLPASLLGLQPAWAQPSDVSADERVILFPALGHRVDAGRAWSVDIHGWIFEDTWTDLSLRALEDALDLDEAILDPAQRNRLRKRLHPFVVDNERGERVGLLIGGRRSLAPPSGVNGHIRHRIELPAGEAAGLQTAGAWSGRLTCRVETGPGDRRIMTGRVHLLEPRGLSVISDIDDTIRVTQVGDHAAVLRSTFLQPFKPVRGMAAAYAAWARRYAAEFHYVSASPYQLYEPLAEFMEAEAFPEGTFHLKSVRLKDRSLLAVFAPSEDFKREPIESILKRFPEREFVCVGDSGERDPEIYGALAREYPQIRRILIRNVTGQGPDAPRYRRAFRGLAGESWKVFDDPAEVHDLGLSPPMVFPDRQWHEASPESQGVDPVKLNEAIEEFSRSIGGDGAQELVIIRNGHLIWRGPRIDKVHGVWSMTKSFTSTVLGLLIDDGKCSLDTPACEILPSLKAAYPAVRLRHFATMTSGYRAAGDEPKGGYLHGPSDTPLKPDVRPLFSPPGSRYAYWDSAMNQFAHVLTRLAGEPIEELFKRRIADPVGMDRAHWDWRDCGPVNGVVLNGGSGNQDRHVYISAREMARFGHLFLNGGRWKDRQLISREWVRMATQVQVPASIPLGHPESGIDGRGVYGFNWWVNGVKPDGQRNWPSAPPGTFAARGHNNNVCFVIPEWNMVVVRLGLDGEAKAWVWDDFLGRLAAAVKGGPLAGARGPAAQTRRGE